MGCVTPVSILAILAILSAVAGQWWLAGVFILLAIPAGLVSTGRSAGRK
jgi:hypothetical protein